MTKNKSEWFGRELKTGDGYNTETVCIDVIIPIRKGQVRGVHVAVQFEMVKAITKVLNDAAEKLKEELIGVELKIGDSYVKRDSNYVGKPNYSAVKEVENDLCLLGLWKGTEHDEE